MIDLLRGALSREDRLARLGPSLVLVLALFAYRPLFLNTFGLPTRHEAESWFFMPGQRSSLFAIGIAGWLLWRRRAALLSLPIRSHGATTAVLAALGASLFLWAQLTAKTDLLIPSLASNLLALASATRGRAGCRALLLPALVLLLAAPIPTPLRSELVWQLQLWTARGAAWLLQIAGYDVALGGVLIQVGERVFTVIDSCSGLRGIEILTLVALLIRDLFATSGRRQWLLILVAPWLGFALNALRVAVVVVTVATPEVAGQAAEDHTPQGVALLLAGTGALYGLGWGMAAAGSRRIHTGVSSKPRFQRGALGLPLRAVLAWLVVLGTVSVTLTPLLEVPATSRPPIEISERLANWRGEDLEPDWIFLGFVQPGQVLSRRYEKKANKNRPPQRVELFVGFEAEVDGGSSRLFTSMMRLPARDWSLDKARRARIWALGLEAELALVSRHSEHALVYTWRLRDQGIWLETARSLLALEFGPFRRERRTLIRLATPLPNDGSLAQDLGKQTLDRFITDFRYELANL